MKNKPTEKGQALILIAFAAVVLFAFAGLAIDGSRNFSQKRHAQNAADTSAYAAALAYTRGDNYTTAIETRAASNGFDNNGTTNTVTITTTDIAANTGICPTGAIGKEFTVTIVSTIDTTISRVIGRDTLTSAVAATSRGCGFTIVDPFNGAAVAGLNPSTTDCAYDSGNSNAAHWTLKNGGIFSNGCAFSKNGGSVTLDPGECVATVSTASNFTCMQPNQTSMQLSTADIIALMPPNPCVSGGVGLTPTSGQTTFSNGVYCISDLDTLDKEDVYLDNATLYVTDDDFSLKFAGGGGFNGTASNSGTYAGYYMIVAYDPTPCPAFNTQNGQTMVLRGNSGGTFSGTILAPTACIDIRGNGEPSGIATQIIGWNVSSNGNAEVYINFSPNPDLLDPIDPTISLIK
jgi:Flp pilus assembly protein TadG